MIKIYWWWGILKLIARIISVTKAYIERARWNDFMIWVIENNLRMRFLQIRNWKSHFIILIGKNKLWSSIKLTWCRGHNFKGVACKSQGLWKDEEYFWIIMRWSSKLQNWELNIKKLEIQNRLWKIKSWIEILKLSWWTRVTKI